MKSTIIFLESHQINCLIFLTFIGTMHIIKQKVIKFILFVVALQMLNMSIDVHNSQVCNNTPENFNYINTYIEFVTEILLKYDNAFPEPATRHQKELQHHKLYQVICQQIDLLTGLPLLYSGLNKVYFNLNDKYAYQFVREISPPPKFSS